MVLLGNLLVVTIVMMLELLLGLGYMEGLSVVHLVAMFIEKMLIEGFRAAKAHAEGALEARAALYHPLTESELRNLRLLYRTVDLNPSRLLLVRRCISSGCKV